MISFISAVSLHNINGANDSFNCLAVRNLMGHYMHMSPSGSCHVYGTWNYKIHIWGGLCWKVFPFHSPLLRQHFISLMICLFGFWCSCRCHVLRLPCVVWSWAGFGKVLDKMSSLSSVVCLVGLIPVTCSIWISWCSYPVKCI